MGRYCIVVRGVTRLLATTGRITVEESTEKDDLGVQVDRRGESQKPGARSWELLQYSDGWPSGLVFQRR